MLLQLSHSTQEVVDVARVKKPPTKTVRVQLDVAREIDTCSAYDQVSTPEWLSDLLRPILLERYPDIIGHMRGLTAGEPKRKRPVTPTR